MLARIFPQPSPKQSWIPISLGKKHLPGFNFLKNTAFPWPQFSQMVWFFFWFSFWVDCVPDSFWFITGFYNFGFIGFIVMWFLSCFMRWVYLRLDKLLGGVKSNQVKVEREPNPLNVRMIKLYSYELLCSWLTNSYFYCYYRIAAVTCSSVKSVMDALILWRNCSTIKPEHTMYLPLKHSLLTLS